MPTVGIVEKFAIRRLGTSVHSVFALLLLLSLVITLRKTSLIVEPEMEATSQSEIVPIALNSKIPSYPVSNGRKLLSVTERSHLIVAPSPVNRVAGDERHT